MIAPDIQNRKGICQNDQNGAKSIEYTLYALHGSCNGFFDI